MHISFVLEVTLDTVTSGLRMGKSASGATADRTALAENSKGVVPQNTVRSRSRGITEIAEIISRSFGTI